MQQAINHIRTGLSSVYTEPELTSIVNILLTEVTGYNRTQLILNKNTKISDNQRSLLASFVEALKTHEPIQYVLGKSEFYGLNFKVGQGVLIPRPETEELVEWILSDVKTQTVCDILDVGTGSGCIAIALKSMLPNVNIHAYDISEQALKIAKINAEMNNCKIQFELQDILNPVCNKASWDVIVSNPPYIPEREKSDIRPNVICFEPHSALFVPDNDPLLFYKSIATFGLKYLNKGGRLFFEIHRSFSNQIILMLKNAGYADVQLQKDISGNDRMIRAVLP